MKDEANEPEKKAKQEKVSVRPSRKQTRIHLLLILAVGGALYYLSGMFFPQDLSDIDGYAEDRPAKVRNINEVLQNAIRQDKLVELTEQELNDYIQDAISLEQTGFQGKISARNLWVRLREGSMELVIEREVWGYPQTVSIILKPSIKNDADAKASPTVELSQVRIGQRYLPQGYFRLFGKSFQNIADLFEKEIQAGFHDMGRIQCKNRRIELDPRPKTLDASGRVSS